MQVHDFNPHTSELSRISARSRKQAMDWSLVLISQGIASEIVHNETDASWGLVVSSSDYENALAAVRQYVIENRGWRWRTEVFRPGLLFDWASLAWVFLVVVFYGLDSSGGLRGAGMMSTAAVAAGQWWRLLTAMWLHGDIAHLMTNVVFGFVFLGLAMGQWGTGTGLLSAYIAGAGGNVIAALLSNGNVSSLGASGMVMSCVGLISAHSLSPGRKAAFASRKYIIAALGAGSFLFILLGLNPGTYVQAHLGGFISGLMLGVMLRANQKAMKSGAANFVSGIAFTVLVIVPWWLALSK